MESLNKNYSNSGNDITYEEVKEHYTISKYKNLKNSMKYEIENTCDLSEGIQPYKENELIEIEKFYIHSKNSGRINNFFLAKNNETTFSVNDEIKEIGRTNPSISKQKLFVKNIINFSKDLNNNVSIHLVLPSNNFNNLLSKVSFIKDAYAKQSVKIDFTYSIVEQENTKTSWYENAFYYAKNNPRDIYYASTFQCDESSQNFKEYVVGYLTKIQYWVFKYLEILDSTFISEDSIKAIEFFVKNKLMRKLPKYFSEYSIFEKQDYLFGILNKPLRVFGIKEYEDFSYGGYPFWVKNESKVYLEMFDKNNIDFVNENTFLLNNVSQYKNLLNFSCSFKNYKGELFSQNEIKSSDPFAWNTIFVEVK